MSNDTVEITRDIEDFAGFFRDALPFEIPLTYVEIGMILTWAQGAGMFAIALESGAIANEELRDDGEEFDGLSNAIHEQVESIKAKFQAAMQAYLDREANGDANKN